MKLIKHGLSIGIERINNKFIMVLKAAGRLSHADYEFISPVLDSAIEEVHDPKIKMLVDINELEGWELRAAWDDFKLGLKHGSKFSKVAIVGQRKWRRLTAKIGGWFIAGEVKSFADFEQALPWLCD